MFLSPIDAYGLSFSYAILNLIMQCIPAGITGIILHELLGVDGLYPTGGLASGAAPPTIF